mgnify:CR=1 FL=1
MANDSLAVVLNRGLAGIFKNAGAVPVRSSMGGWLREANSGDWQRGISVDAIGSITSFSAVFACVACIAQDVSKLAPKHMQRDGRSGVWTELRAATPPVELLRRPNHFSTRLQFLERWVTSKLLHGNAYALKSRNARGEVVALFMVDPRRVTPMVTPQGDVYYSVGGDDLSRIPEGMVVPASEVIHDRGMTLWHPLVGVSPLTACALSATQGNRIQTNSATFFQNMSRPSGMLTAPETISDETAIRLKQDFERNFAGSNIGKLLVLGDGLDYKPMTIPASDAQMIEQLRWTVEDVARAFRVPLFKINAGPPPNMTNVEALESSYYSGCLQGLIESLEQCLDHGLGLPIGQRIEFDLHDLLRMDSAGRFDALGKAVGGGWLSPNEARAREDLPPVDGGDSPLMQVQNYSLAALAKRDSQPDPFGTAADPAQKARLKAVVEELTRAAAALARREKSMPAEAVVQKSSGWPFNEPVNEADWRVYCEHMRLKQLNGDHANE